MNLRFRPLAATQLEELVDYHYSLSEKVGVKFQKSVERALSKIEQFPNAWPRVTKKTRVFPIRRYHVGVFFQTDGKVPRVIGFVDLRTNWRARLKSWE